MASRVGVGWTKVIMMKTSLLIFGLLAVALCFYSCEKTSSDDQTTNASSDEKTNPDDETVNGSNDDETVDLPELPESEDVDDVCTKMKDINFMAYCYDNFDVNHDSKVSMTEAAAVSTISCSTATDFTGIEYFSWLKSFTSNSVETIDLRYNTELASIVFKGAPIKQIDLSYNFNLTSIGEDAFRGCISLTSIDLPSSLTSLGAYAFSECTSLISIDLFSGITSIGERAFNKCIGLTSIFLPAGLTQIDGYAFCGCTALTSVTLFSGLLSIGYGAFRDCSSLTFITFPSDLMSIGPDVFLFCTSLTSISLPLSLVSLGGGAFQGCSALNTVLSNAITPPDLGVGVFSTIGDSVVLHVPSESVTEYKNSDWADYFTEILPL